MTIRMTPTEWEEYDQEVSAEWGENWRAQHDDDRRFIPANEMSEQED